MTIRNALLLPVLATACLLSAETLAAEPQSDGTARRAEASSEGGSRSPNVLFIAIDDLRPELGCYGVDAIHSPNIDALAASSVQFNRAYCQVAVCNPSRVSVMTGLRPDSSKVWTLDVRFRETVPDTLTLPAHFKNHGYHAVSFGKIFHNPWPDNESWSEPHAWPGAKLWSEDALKRHREYRDQMRADGKSDKAVSRMRAPAVEKVDVPDHEHIDGAIAQQAIKAMRRLAKKDEPFFLAAGFVRPHLPFVVPRKYWDLYDPEAIELATNTTFPENFPTNVPAMNTGYELRDYMDYADTPAYGEGLLTSAQQRELKHGYYASVSLIDAQVGLLLEELDALGLADNTIVVLWSDHGWKLGEHGAWCKQTNYEIDARVPFIVRAPNAKANGSKTDALVELLDIYPTLCDLAGLDAPRHIEGKTLRPLLENPSSKFKDAAFSQYYRTQDGRHYMGYAMRTDRYRYVDWKDRETNETAAQELYDHKNDPEELTNIAPDPANEKLLGRLNRQLWAALPTPPKYEKQKTDRTPYEGKATANKRPTLTLINQVADPLKVAWIRPDGSTKPSGKGTIAPGATHRITTTLGHRFLVENPKTGFKKTVTVTKQNQSVTFNRRQHSAAQPQSGQTSKASPVRTLPNVLFLMADDWSWPHASALGDPTVETPTFDRVAREGVLFENAFVSAPSCTPSRHAVSSGQFHWRPGVGADLGSSMAADVPVYPDLLAEAGYQTGFSRKGTGPSKHTHRGNDPFGSRFDSFEQFHEQRDSSKPFCFWYGAGEPHRPYQWQASHKAGIDLDSIVIPPGLPDNDTVRTDLGDYYVKVQRYDSDSARMIALLEESGELENTIVVMTGDNGMPFPRQKATLYDGGTRVPLAIRWGAKVKGGRSISDFVSLTDLAPTFLEAAGLDVPAVMTGRSLLGHLAGGKSGSIDPSRDHVLTGVEHHVYTRPRRAIRTKDYLLIRNFSPQNWPTGEIKGGPPRFDFVKEPWPTGPGAFSFSVDPSPTKQWMLHHRDGPEAERLYQLSFGSPPAVELYDLASDPGQLNNVASDPAYAATLKALRNRLFRGLRETNDPRFAPKENTAASRSVDLRPEFEARKLGPRHQGKRGACQVFAFAGVLEYQLSRPGSPVDLSEQFLMWAANEANDLDSVEGWYPEILFKGLRTHGICEEALMSYVGTPDTIDAPAAKARKAANARRTARIEQLRHWYNPIGFDDADIAGIQRWLDEGDPLTATFSWAYGVPDDEAVDDEHFLIDDKVNLEAGGHGVILLGYGIDESVPGGGWFLLRNSWGEKYGDGGYAKMSYEYARKYGLDAYRVVLADAGGKDEPKKPVHTEHEIKGWTLRINQSLWENDPKIVHRALEILALQLDRVIEVVPDPALKQLREVPLWMNPPHDGMRQSAEYHPDAGWLRRNGRDPVMAKSIEFTNAKILPFENRRMPYVALHELAHGFHDRVLGFDEPRIIAAYQRAKKSGIYDEVKRWMGNKHIVDKAYAITDHKEYFAENTEAYFGKNDFYPFTREELKEHDPEMHALLETLWGVGAAESAGKTRAR